MSIDKLKDLRKIRIPFYLRPYVQFKAYLNNRKALREESLRRSEMRYVCCLICQLKLDNNNIGKAYVHLFENEYGKREFIFKYAKDVYYTADFTTGDFYNRYLIRWLHNTMTTNEIKSIIASVNAAVEASEKKI